MSSSGEPGRCEHGKLYAEFCWDCVDRSAALGSSGSGEALSEARLAEIREQVDEYARKVYKQADVEFGYGLHELLAEVERQRTALAAAEAREAAMDVCDLHTDRPGKPREMRSWRYHSVTGWELVSIKPGHVCEECAARWDALDARAEAGEAPEMPRWLVDAEALEREGVIRLVRNPAYPGEEA